MILISKILWCIPENHLTQIKGTTSSEEKAKIAKAAGCDDVILYTQQDFVEETKKLTNGKGVNVVYDSVSFPAKNITIINKIIKLNKKIK